MKKPSKRATCQKKIDVRSLAKLTATMIWGLSVQAINGSSSSELKKAAELAISSFDILTGKD